MIDQHYLLIETSNSIALIDSIRQAIVNHSEETAANALCDVITKQIESGNVMRVSGNETLSQNWWKLHEASILAFGLAKDVIVEKQLAGTLRFDVVAFLENVVLADLNNSGKFSNTKNDRNSSNQRLNHF